METAREFFEQLYRDCDHDKFCALWQLPSRATQWTRPNDLEAFDKYAADSHTRLYDAYFAVCTQKDIIKRSRGLETNVAQCPALWADIDFPKKKKPGQKKQAIYPTEQQAADLLWGIPITPTIIYHTGGGIHAYWFLDRPIDGEDEASRLHFKSTLERWQAFLRHSLKKAVPNGATIDPTFDLVRVLRVPGSYHTKELKTVSPWSVTRGGKRLYDAARRVSIAEILDIIGEANLPQPIREEPTKQERIKIAVPDAMEAAKSLDPNKLGNLMMLPEFKLTWEEKRSNKLTSHSEYDLALASFARNAGWKNEEIAALIVEWNRLKHPDRLPKVLRPPSSNGKSYLDLTIDRARKDRNRRQAIDDIQESGEDRAKDKAWTLDRVSEILQVTLKRFIQTGNRDESFSIVIEHQKHDLEITLGSARDILQAPDRVCERIVVATGNYVEVTKEMRRAWAKIMQCLFQIVEKFEVKEAETKERVEFLIQEHLRRHHGGQLTTNGATRAQAAYDSSPFRDDTHQYISGSQLKKLASELDKSLSIKGEMHVGLRQLGYACVTIHIPSENTSRSYWKGPIKRAVQQQTGEQSA